MDVSRLHRVLRLLTLLQGSPGLSTADLMRELAVSRRTLFRDLSTLKAAGVPYYHDAGEGYRIAPEFFLPPVNLKAAEAMGLLTLARLAQSQRHQPLLAPAVEGIRKIMAALPSPMRQVCDEMMGRVSVHSGAVSNAGRNGDVYAVLQQAVDERRVVQMRYRSLFEGGRIELKLRPYHLHFSVRAWYVIGYSEKDRQVRTYKMARIEDVQLTGRTFAAVGFQLEDHLGHAWQMIPEGKVYQVELEFTPKVATNVSEVRWHRSQQAQMLDDGRCILRFEVDGLGEITWWLLGYGDQVLVREPAELRRRVAEVYQSALSRYGESSNGRRTGNGRKKQRKGGA